jgi:hypothetical protein
VACTLPPISMTFPPIVAIDRHGGPIVPVVPIMQAPDRIPPPSGGVVDTTRKDYPYWGSTPVGG